MSFFDDASEPTSCYAGMDKGLDDDPEWDPEFLPGEACDDAPEDELECPLCPHTVWVSPEDGDASLSEMHRHFRRHHHGEDANELLARVRLVEGGAR